MERSRLENKENQIRTQNSSPLGKYFVFCLLYLKTRLTNSTIAYSFRALLTTSFTTSKPTFKAIGPVW